MLRYPVPHLQEVHDTALRPHARSGWRFWGLAAVLALVICWGFVGYVIQLGSGLGAAGYSDTAFWGIYEANLVAFIGVSYGGALVSAILRLTHAKWRAPITRLSESFAVFALVVGMLFAVIHLGRPERIWRIVLTPQIASPLVWDFVAIMSYLVVTMIFLYLPLIPDLAVMRDQLAGDRGLFARLYRIFAINWRGLPEQWHALNGATTAVAILIIPLAVSVHSVLSWAFAVTSRPGWHSTIFGPDFVVAALYSGVAAVILVVAGFRKGYRLDRFINLKHFQNLAFILLTLDVLYLYFTFTELLTEGYAMDEEVVPVVASLLVGQYAPYFWLFVVGAGLLPIVLIAVPRTRTISGIVVAASFTVAGMWLKRLLIVVPAVAQPLIAGQWGSFHPTWIALSITLGAAAAIPLLLMLFFKFVPILAIGEMEEMAAEEERVTAPSSTAEPLTARGDVTP
jgi:Ni/Fe-hydrogenase subunit HybB-like protein